jgi:DNA (cytosine-5)-methyltransferase 1
MTQKKRVIDLFSGVGGLSLGAARAGFDVVGAVELDAKAIKAHRKNFPNTQHVDQDISTLTGEKLLQKCGVGRRELDGLIGGPPCQGFSTIGHRRTDDPRNSLLTHFFRLVNETRPAFFLAENVPGVLHQRNAITLNSALEVVPKRYTLLAPIKVTASDFGVPTLRTRVFFVGFDAERCDAIAEDAFAPDEECADVRVKDALRALPAIRSTWQAENDSWRSVGAMDDSEYAGFIQGEVPVGIGDPTALELYRSRRLTSGFLGTAHEEETVKRFSRLRQGETDPISRAMRLDRDGYCPTLRAGTGPDRGSYQSVRPVHPTSPRVIAPREAARLQGFPDWFQFDATKWHAFRQIGNSVSPIVAANLLRIIAAHLGANARH